jgi:hypothetical protein
MQLIKCQEWVAGRQADALDDVALKENYSVQKLRIYAGQVNSESNQCETNPGVVATMKTGHCSYEVNGHRLSHCCQ